jgi:hypothetical protein
MPISAAPTKIYGRFLNRRMDVDVLIFHVAQGRRDLEVLCGQAVEKKQGCGTVR